LRARHRGGRSRRLVMVFLICEDFHGASRHRAGKRHSVAQRLFRKEISSGRKRAWAGEVIKMIGDRANGIEIFRAHPLPPHQPPPRQEPARMPAMPGVSAADRGRAAARFRDEAGGRTARARRCTAHVSRAWTSARSSTAIVGEPRAARFHRSSGRGERGKPAIRGACADRSGTSPFLDVGAGVPPRSGEMRAAGAPSRSALMAARGFAPAGALHDRSGGRANGEL